MFGKVHNVNVNSCNGHKSLIYIYTCLYYILKDVVELLNPESEMSREECSGESSISAVEAECEPQPLDVDVIEEEDETQVATMPSSASASETSPCTFLRAKYTQTTAFKPTTRFNLHCLLRIQKKLTVSIFWRI